MVLVFSLYVFLLWESYMDWALGFSPEVSSIEVLTSTEGIEYRSLPEISRERPLVPPTLKMRRLLYEGDVSSWSTSGADEYLAGLNVVLPPDCENRHTVFRFMTENGVTVHMPSLVLMQAIFKPSQFLFPAAFSPIGPDLFGYVDYSQTPAGVVIDDLKLRQRTLYGLGNSAPAQLLEWLLISKSARQATHSVYLNALKGWLSLTLPLGRIRIAIHGPLVAGQLFAVKANVVAMTIAADDSLAGTSKTLIFHAMADSNRKPAVSVAGINIPLHPDGSSAITNKEWELVEPILSSPRKSTERRHSRRDLLDAILFKLSHNVWWIKVPTKGFATTDLVSTFRRWKTTGRFDQVLEVLETSRSNGVYSRGQSN